MIDETDGQTSTPENLLMGKVPDGHCFDMGIVPDGHSSIHCIIYKVFDKIGILPSLSHKMASILSRIAILTSVLSPDILSMHRVICPAKKCPSMKYPYPRQYTPIL